MIQSKKKTGGNRTSFQDKARHHTARNTMETIRKLKWDLLLHPPYSPDIAQVIFYLGDLKVTWRECSLRITTK